MTEPISEMPPIEAAPSLAAPEWQGRARAAQSGPSTLLIALIGVALALASGVSGGLLVLLLRPTPPPVHYAVVDFEKVKEALVEVSKLDPEVLDRFPGRFDDLLRRLQEEDPSRLILVRAAVLGEGADDLTPLVLQEMRVGGAAKSGRKPNAR